MIIIMRIIDELVQISALKLSSYVNLNKFLNVSVLHFITYKMGRLIKPILGHL